MIKVSELGKHVYNWRESRKLRLHSSGQGYLISSGALDSGIVLENPTAKSAIRQTTEYLGFLSNREVLLTLRTGSCRWDFK